MLQLTYTIDGELDGLLVPAARPPRRGERLWQHTCCELFVRRAGSPAYYEFNFSPSGEWAAYAFAQYREAVPLADEGLDPQVSAGIRDGKLVLDACVVLERIAPGLARAPLALGLSAVMEELDGSLSYWALRHAAGKPDFHHPEAFALQLADV